MVLTSNAPVVTRAAFSMIRHFVLFQLFMRITSEKY